MARYIDVDKFAERIELSPAFKKMAFKGDLLQRVVLDLLDNAPIADVVKVPCRCSKCEHLEIINKEPVYAECKKQKLTFLLWQADTREHFCSYGKRRDK